MNNFNPEADRLRQAKHAETLAGLRAGQAGAADRMTAAVQETDPVAVHLGILRRRFPTLRFDGFRPDLRSLAGIVELVAYFSPPAIRERQRIERHFREYFSASPARRREMEISTLGHPLRRRSPWSRLAFWR